MAVLLGGAAGFYKLRPSAEAWLHSHHVFAIRALRVTGQQHIAEQEVIRFLALTPEDDLLSIKLDAMHEALMRHPWIASAQIRRVFPSTLEVHIREHRPRAIVVLGGFYLVDEKGEIFSRVMPMEKPNLPIITGLTRTLFEENNPEWQRLLAMANGFADIAAEESLATGEIQVDPAIGIIAHLPGGGAQAFFGFDHFREKTHKLKNVLALLKKGNKSPAAIYLTHTRHPERVVVRTKSPGTNTQ